MLALLELYDLLFKKLSYSSSGEQKRLILKERLLICRKHKLISIWKKEQKYEHKTNKKAKQIILHISITLKQRNEQNIKQVKHFRIIDAIFVFMNRFEIYSHK